MGLYLCKISLISLPVRHLTSQLNMRILYPFNPLNPKEVDEPYQEEFHLLKTMGFNCSLFDFASLEAGEFNPKPNLKSGEKILYRGWMLNPEHYQKLVQYIEKKGSIPVTNSENYLKCHHLPGWYAVCEGFTPETRFFNKNKQLKDKIQALAWDAYFVKDFVKSNSTAKGSIALSADEAIEIIELIETYRGEIEGGIAIRRVEKYKNNTEVRYFVFNGKVYSPNDTIPDIVLKIAAQLDAPFYAMDVIQRQDSEYRLVEIGDGQVSDKKTWTTDTFVQMLVENLQ